MVIMVKTTQECPCCKYEYKEVSFFKKRVYQSIQPKVENGKELVSSGDLLFIRAFYQARQEIPAEFVGKCDVVDVVDDNNAILVKRAVIAGDLPFEDEVCSEDEKSENQISTIPKSFKVFCPHCGVLINSFTCTTIEEEVL